MVVLSGARVVTPTGVVDDGWLRVEDATIAEVGRGRPPAGAGPRLVGYWVLPGFVDLHVHGGGGASMLAADPDEIAAAAAFHRAHGTTTTLASLVTAPVGVMVAGVGAIATLVERGTTGVVGSHLEGPFLSGARCGAQDPRYVLEPDPAALAALLTAGRGTVRVVTLAPERPGGLDLVRATLAAGAVAAIGHTDATCAEADAAIADGASLATHLCNAMRPIHHREPGAVGAALRAPSVVCEVINDGAHVHDAMVATIFAAAGADRVALITDAIPAAGSSDGVHRLGDRTVEVHDGIARLSPGGALAGSTLTMDVAVRRAVRDVGVPIDVAAAAAATTPARVLGLADRTGSITAGLRADLVVLDDELDVVAVMAAGQWVHGAGALGA
jgi:N-acetylglucosamine-6-phosphate deacetylase